MLQVHPFVGCAPEVCLILGQNLLPWVPVHGEDQWTAVDAVVAREEAKAIHKASIRIACSKGKVSPSDVSADKPRKGKKAKQTKSDKVSADNIFYDPTDAMNNVFTSPPRSPELRRRNEALQFARGTNAVTASRSPRTVWTPPTLHSLDVESGLRLFSTPSLAAHLRGPPPGFAAPLTPRECIARA